MPSKSKAQHNLMAMVAHDPAAAKRLGISQKVGKEFVKADTGRKFSKGGQTMATAKIVKPTPMGKVKTAAPSRDGVAVKGKTKGKNLGDSGKTVGIQSGAKRGKK